MAKPGSPIAAFLRAIPVLFSARLFALAVLPLVGAALVWILVSWVRWGQTTFLFLNKISRGLTQNSRIHIRTDH